MSKSPLGRINPSWKVALAFLSIFLTVLVWKTGLQESFSRPSVSPTLSLHQKEMAVLAEEGMPSAFRPFLLGEPPRAALLKTLREVSLDDLGDRERLLLGALEPTSKASQRVLLKPVESNALAAMQSVLLTSISEEKTVSFNAFNELFAGQEYDHLLRQVLCESITADKQKCINLPIAKSIAVRLIISQLFPVFAALSGLALLIRQLWIFIRKTSSPWPKLFPLPLSLADMVLLIAGGFVVLGEVVAPLFIAPFSGILTKNIASPVDAALKVVIGYSAMALPPLFILRKQLQGLESADRPLEGWLQWRFRPFPSAFVKAIQGWLMVMPPVLLTGWLITKLVGDQGGSNPLLELVLNSKDPLALFLLVVTTVLLAPLFEEIIFRGVLLPVLAKSFGQFWGVVTSALIFAMAHLSVGELAPLMVLGIGLAMLRLSSGRLFPCVLMHALWNGVTFSSLLLLGT
ncbi:CPBP family intramembrane glutamic endopeptidase [Prochlorococcus sp. MIT 1300]|uniref:CPBP family intramembrane glutamic endopeptidase n=1 Tax=Prochlorococcus sp. MIT 1300 TaxID=3096218 RepID=UPI002A75D8FC|nr:CPBP family intramembrane glutamic endopeptidase [Prochlorococcus sp. MIT 1300]